VALDSYLELRQVSLEYVLPTGGASSLFRPWDWRKTIRVQALREVSLTVKSGESVALLGRNGAGKTSLLRVFAGIYHPTTGAVTRQGAIRALLDTGFGLDPGLSGRDNANTYAVILGLRRPDRQAFVEQVRRDTGLGDSFERPVRSYSQGMVARLIFALSTSGTPQILLLDEAMGAGDAAFQAFAVRRVAEFLASASIVITSSHSLDFLRQNCERGIVLESGAISFDGTIDDAADHYAELLR